MKQYIRNIPDFPKPGINFKDITPLLASPEGFEECIGHLVKRYQDSRIDKIGALDARGFLFGTPLARELGLPFFPIRKAGKLPYETIKQSYGLEYGQDSVEIHTDAVKEGDLVLLVDDLLATGGTMKAATTLVERLGGKVHECAFVIELKDLDGRKKLENYDIHSVLQY